MIVHRTHRLLNYLINWKLTNGLKILFRRIRTEQLNILFSGKQHPNCHFHRDLGFCKSYWEIRSFRFVQAKAAAVEKALPDNEKHAPPAAGYSDKYDPRYQDHYNSRNPGQSSNQDKGNPDDLWSSNDDSDA